MRPGRCGSLNGPAWGWTSTGSSSRDTRCKRTGTDRTKIRPPWVPGRRVPWTRRGRFITGVAESLPLWLGVLPFGVVYAAVGRRAGLNVRDIQLMSLLVYAGGAQFTAVRLAGQGAAAGLLVVTAALINLRHVLYGLSLAPHLRTARPVLRAAAAFFLVDESYGLTQRASVEGRGGPAYLLGAGTALYLAWNLGTGLGIAFSALL